MTFAAEPSNQDFKFQEPSPSRLVSLFMELRLVVDDI